MMKDKSTNKDKPASEALSVLIGDELVGTLAWIAPDKTIFTLDGDYIQNERRRTLTSTIALQEQAQLREVLWKANMSLAPFFSNLLPEGPLRSYLARINGINMQREFFLLKALKDDLPGAVRLEASSRDFSLTHEHGSVADEPPSAGLRFSLGGVQLKFSALLDASGGLTVPVHGIGGSWIVKLASHQYANVPENEYCMMEMARRCGIDVPAVELKDCAAISGLPLGLPPHFDTCFAVKRFDRQETKRVHIEDFCQVFNVPPQAKYSKQFNYNHMAAFIWRNLGEADLLEFVRRLVFNIAIGNNDMHLKNWSLIYRDGVTAALAPAYDLLATRLYVMHDELSLRLGDATHMEKVGTETFQNLIKTAKLPAHLVLSAVAETVDRFHAVWQVAQSDLPVPKAVRESINAHLKSVPLMRQSVSV